MSSFIIFCQANQLNWVDVASLDVRVCVFFDQMFLNGYGGEEAEEGSKYLAALAFFLPDVSRMGPFSLPGATRAMRGWTKSAPGHQRLPLPRVLLCAVIRVLLAAQWILMAFALWLSFRAYLRPGECSSLTRRQLVEPVPSAGSQYVPVLGAVAVSGRPQLHEPSGQNGIVGRCDIARPGSVARPPAPTLSDRRRPLGTAMAVQRRGALRHLQTDHEVSRTRSSGPLALLLRSRRSLRGSPGTLAVGSSCEAPRLLALGQLVEALWQGGSTSKRAEQCVPEGPSVRSTH